ncbi:putative permease of the major facilitator superfamily protein [Tsukamurella sp. TY48]|nr:putative permease of the major facilitator superfamily protein [Tsukamurella sp. TY48]
MGLLPDIAADLGVSEPVAGHVIAAYALGVVVGAPLIAAAFAREQRRTLLVALMVAFTLGNTLSVIAPNYETLMAARFIAGLPHGAFFGVAALVAAHLAGPAGRGRAVGQVLMGLSVANVIGVPLTTWLGDAFGWRYALSVVVVIGAATVIALLVWLPAVDIPVTNPLTELGALRRPQVWFALLTGVVGFGGMFAVYTYISTTLTSVSGLEKSAVPFVLAVYGVGMVIGNVVGGRAADFSVNRSIVATLAGLVVLQALFSAFAPEPVAAISLFFLIGLTGSALVPALQTRLMDVAGEAQTLAATLNHSALNIANALGAFLGGAVIAAGYGYTAPALVGSGLAVAGLGVFGIGLLAARRAPEPVGARR